MKEYVQNKNSAFWHTVLWFFCGAILYPSIEVLYRGYSHYSMMLAGGLCAVLLYYLNGLYGTLPRWLRTVSGAGLIILVEFIFGVIFNIFLQQSVWDYSSIPFNLMGQISLRYSFIWCGFSFLLTWIFDRVWAAEKNKTEKI